MYKHISESIFLPSLLSAHTDQIPQSIITNFYKGIHTQEEVTSKGNYRQSSGEKVAKVSTAQEHNTFAQLLACKYTHESATNLLISAGQLFLDLEKLLLQLLRLSLILSFLVRPAGAQLVQLRLQTNLVRREVVLRILAVLPF